MSFAETPYRSNAFSFAADAGALERADFIRKTYLNLAGAIGGFIALELIWFQIPAVENIAPRMVTGWNWLIVMGAFILVSYIAQSWARSAVSVTTQYMGLSLYVLAESVIFLPLLFLAVQFDRNTGAGVVQTAAFLTLAIFGGLTGFVFVTRKDFSFLRTALFVGAIAFMGLIVASLLFGFSLGVLFAVFGVVLAVGYILYDTSNVLHHYRIGQHVAAALALFASVALLFWYILQLVMSFNSRD